MESLAVTPTRLFAAEMVPPGFPVPKMFPFVPLTHVTAPTFVATGAGCVQVVLTTT
jgi:hypothetical protein